MRHLARTKRNALGGKGFGGNIFVAHGGKIFAISLTSTFVSCLFLFRAMENPPTSAAELDSDPDSPHLDQFSLLLVVGSGLHWACILSLTAQPSAPSWRSTTWKKREACRSRSCSSGLSLVLRSKATASCRRLSSGGFRGVADFVHGKMDGMHVWSTASSSTFEAFPRTRAFVFTLPWLFCILASQVFNFFSSDRHFSCDKCSFGSSWPFFFPSLSSLFFCSVFQGTPSHSSCTAWQSLQNISTSVRRQAMEWESFLIAVRAAGTSEHAAGLDHFESSDRISACIVKEHWAREAWWKFSACHPVRDAMRDKT